MSDFLSQQQSDELVNGNYYDGEYQPTEQDLADMNEAWPIDLSDDGDALASAGWGTDEDYWTNESRKALFFYAYHINIYIYVYTLQVYIV